MSNAVIQDVEGFFEDLWSKLVEHVKPIAEGEAKQVLDDAKAQLGQLASEGAADLEKDATEVEAGASQVASAAEGATTPAQS